jgi:bifunctional DNase/RNase
MKREVKILGLSYSQSQIGSYVCVLSEERGQRKLPIIVKPQDAQTIALRIEGMKSPRPMTHDLIKNISESFQLDCQEVYIFQVLEGIFYAKIRMSNGIDDSDIETTAGDAIALSLVFDCPLYVSEDVLSMCGLVTDEEGNPVDNYDEQLTPEQKDIVDSKLGKQRNLNKEELIQLMNEAVSNEDYELAAQYRDKISEIEKN